MEVRRKFIRNSITNRLIMKIYSFIMVIFTSINLVFGQDKPIIFQAHKYVEMDIEKDLLSKKYVLGTISLDIAKKKIVIKANNLEDIYTITEIVKQTREGTIYI